MAQLKDTIVQGSARITDTVYTTNLVVSNSASVTGTLTTNDLVIVSSKTARYVLAAPTSAGAPTFRALTNADVGLGNVENTKLSSWTGSTAVTTVGTISTGTWSGTAIAANKGGTGQTSYAVGDMLYASGASAISKLTGNTSAIKKVLTMTGTGSAGAAPVWSNIGNGRIFYGTCDTAAATVPKVVTCTSYDALTVGDIIVVKFTTTNSKAVASITMNVNGKGALNVKKLYNGAINNLSAVGEINASVPGVFVYDGTYWILLNGDYNSNDNTIAYYTRYAANLYKSSAAIAATGKILLQGDNNTMIPISAKTATANETTPTITTASFLIFGDYLYYSTTLAANTVLANGSAWTRYTIDARYSINSGNMTAQKDLFLVATPDTDGIHAKLRNPTTTGLTSGPVTHTLPTTEDGYIYIKIGTAYSTTNLHITENHPVYWYKAGKLRPYTAPYGTISTVSGSTLSLTDIDSTQVATYTPSVTVPASTPVLEWNTGVTLATVNSVDIKAALPANPWKVYYSSATPTGTIAEGSLWFKPM